MNDLAKAHVEGWNACRQGVDGRYGPHEPGTEMAGAWNSGWMDSLESEDADEPAPECFGYGRVT